MPDLKGSTTQANLKEAFAGESQANRRYLYFAQKADVEGYPDVAALFRSVAEGETGHAFGHFDFLAEVGDPVTGEAVGATSDNLRSAVAGETYEYTEMYPGFARTARDEGFDEVAEWLETLREATGMALLGPGQRLEPFTDGVEALVAGSAGEAGVHLGVLVGLTLDGRAEVVLGGADGEVGHRVAGIGEEVEVPERMAGLAFRNGTEERGHVGVALDVGLLGEVQVATVRLGLAGERVLQVLVGLGALELSHGLPSWGGGLPGRRGTGPAR